MYNFEYKKFYDYYTNPSNLEKETYNNDCVEMYFFKKSKKADKSEPQCNYMKVNGKKIYVNDVKDSSTYMLLFSIPTTIDGNKFDFHYTFGIRSDKYLFDIRDKYYIQPTLEKKSRIKKRKKSSNRTKKKRIVTNTTTAYSLSQDSPKVDMLSIDKSKQLIYFHKTIQTPTGYNSDKIPIGRAIHQYCYFQDNMPITNINSIICLDKDKTMMGWSFTEEEKAQIREIMQRPFMKIVGGKHRKSRK